MAAASEDDNVMLDQVVDAINAHFGEETSSLSKAKDLYNEYLAVKTDVESQVN